MIRYIETFELCLFIGKKKNYLFVYTYINNHESVDIFHLHCINVNKLKIVNCLLIVDWYHKKHFIQNS